jgi:peptidylprolyl isomerase
MKWITAFFLLFTAPAFTQENAPMSEKNPVMRVETTLGTFEVTLFPKIAPKTCENFMKLSEKNYYNGTKFHRIIPQFMIQGGDPLGNGTGGKSIWGRAFEDECKNDVKFDKPGLLAMANSGPNTNGSQFFITTAKTNWLDMRHTIFGEVTSGYEVIKKIEAMGSNSGAPKEKVEILKITQLP